MFSEKTTVKQQKPAIMETSDRLYKILEFIQQENEHEKKAALEILHKVVESTASISDDAKRIKVVLLHRHECGPCALTNKFEIAHEWGKMEDKLHDESFWMFINPNPNDQRYAHHRMTYVIEMLLRCEKEENGGFVDVSTLLLQNPHYLFERCLPIMLDMKTDKVPFLQCDIHLDELIDEALLMPNKLHEISPGMFALWIALKMTFERLWSWYTFMKPDNPENCFAADINGVRDFLLKFITVRKEDLVMTGRTLGEYLEEECEE